ncbi:MAG: EAL domain-containing protein [Pseudomonadota bacterium]|nr:EAL domain-containing protein [Pseudomonadota bacterium]
MTQASPPSNDVQALTSGDSLQVEKIFRAGQVIMRQGDPGDCAYFIQEGRVQISVKLADGSLVNVAQRGAGSVIGEMAIVDGGPRSATITAIEDCQLLEITQADFSKAVSNANPIVGLVARLILMRYRDLLHRSATLRDFDGDSSVLERQEHEHAQQSRVLDAVRMTNEFRVAIAGNQLFLEYQPFIEISSGRVVGFEALMRWQHPVQGRMRPDLFIPLAEDTGQIVEATRWAFHEACHALKNMVDASGNDQLFMSINFSAHDFDEPDFLEHLLQIVDHAGVRPDQIHIEITERLLLRQAQHVRAALLQCREAGMDISIDDFGTGYSSLSYLHQYPVSTLKIDKSFISNMTRDDSALGLVRTILSLSDNLGLSVIAEGVETEEQVSMLRTLRCQVAQGFLYAKPLGLDRALELVAPKDGGSCAKL